ncbi:hypothetical protein GO755_00060 [Spirosoma sp. HMF4905]|uniref:Uncharacterized protein n=1 Tax=Spirosoma arboris TaxID=2682092 RepID=A0A7K1S3W9_9BACT|nr:hypothetical protein [Spirosoma arboris]MVM28405.1 hypothetical protein [Spirosoma arboris]
MTLKGLRFLALARLKITPDVFFDLTLAETIALLQGEADREVFTARQTRRIAGLLRNAHFAKPVDEMDFMPLPGDEEIKAARPKFAPIPPKVMLEMMSSAFGVPLKKLNN